MGHRKSSPGVCDGRLHSEARARAEVLGFRAWDSGVDARFNDEAALLQLLKGRTCYGAGGALPPSNPTSQTW